MADIKEKTEALNKAFENITPEKMEKIAGGLSKKAKKIISGCAVIAAIITGGGILYHNWKKKPENNEYDDGSELLKYPLDPHNKEMAIAPVPIYPTNS